MADLQPNNIEKDVISYLNGHNWKTNTSVDFAHMSSPIIGVKGRAIHAYTYKINGGCAPNQIITFFEDRLSQIANTGVSHFTIYIHKVISNLGFIRFGVHTKSPSVNVVEV